MTEQSGLVAALVEAQAEMEGAKKDAKNPHFKNTYASLESVVDAVKPALQKHGLAFIQKFHETTGGVAVETIILHKSGEQLSNGILTLPASKQDAQGYGSAITYARRYSLQSAFGIAPEDDDGNAACGNKADKGTSTQSSGKPKQPYQSTPESSSEANVGATSDDLSTIVDTWEKEADKHVNTVDELGKWYKTNEVKIKALHPVARSKVNAYVKQLKESIATPASWDCPKGGKVAAVDCGSCIAVADCEVAKNNIKEK